MPNVVDELDENRNSPFNLAMWKSLLWQKRPSGQKQTKNFGKHSR